jgi:hypothetical protein
LKNDLAQADTMKMSNQNINKYYSLKIDLNRDNNSSRYCAGILGRPNSSTRTPSLSAATLSAPGSR